jgi:hypothetical protein
LVKLVQASAGIEAATGVALILAPALVVRLLFGPDMPAAALPIARVAGIALIALGLACWQNRWHTGNRPQAFRALLTYNALVAGYLVYLALVGHVGGILIWPVIALHAAIAAGLVWTRRAIR